MSQEPSPSVEASPAGRDLRYVALIALATLVVALLLAFEHGHGLASLLVHPDTKDLASNLEKLAAPLLVLLAVRKRRRISITLLVLFSLFTLAVLAARAANRAFVPDDDLPWVLGYGVYIGAIFVWLQNGSRFARTLVAAGFLLGAAYLATTGVWLRLGPLPPTRFLLENTHALVGIYFAPLVFAFLWRHVVEWESAARGAARALGFVSAIAWLGVVLTGANRIVTGGQHFAFGGTFVHVTCAIVAVVTTAIHLLQALRSLAKPAAPGGARRGARFAAWALVAIVALALGIAQGAWPPSAERGRGEADWTAEEAESKLANPRSGVTAMTLSGSGMPRELLSEKAKAPGCANTASCHQLETEDFQRSAHHLAANPAYQLVVSGLVREEGIESARLCAACHDVVPLLAGEMVPGEPYPTEVSEGVTCVACHSARAFDGPPPGDGRYRLAPLTLLPSLFSVPAVQTMSVYEHLDTHFDAIRSEHLRDDALCGACHDLRIGDATLRRTYSEFRGAALTTPDGAPKTCRSCHMPLQREAVTDEKTPHDHAMRGSNIGLATLGGAPLEERVRFIAEAIVLSATREEGSTRLRCVLENRGGGHGFPTAPLDLVMYWFEARPALAPDDAWVRVGPERLFGEKLFGEDGARLDRHEIWKVAKIEEDGERIPPGASRAWEIELPPSLSGNILVRLRHQRYPKALAAELRVAGVMVDPVEITRTEALR